MWVLYRKSTCRGLKCEQATDHGAGTESEWENNRSEYRWVQVEDHRSGYVEVAQRHRVKENYIQYRNTMILCMGDL